MKSKFVLSSLVMALTLSLTPISAISSVTSKYNDNIGSADELLDFQKKMSKTNDKTREELIGRDLKLRALSDYARSVAIRAGISAALTEINGQISANARQLDAIYNFNPLMIHGRVVPPVITEARDLYNQSGDLEIRTSEAIFKIFKQARFASTAPNWRNYLVFPIESSAYEKYSYTGGDLMPTDAVEKEVWEEATRAGWKEGIQQASIMLEQSFDRLNRDYVGMVRYHLLTVEGKVTMPVVSDYRLYDSNNGTKMVLDEKLLKLEVLPTFVKKNSTLGIYTSNNDAVVTNDLTQPVAIKDEHQNKEVLKDVQNIKNETVPKPSEDFFQVPPDPLTTGSRKVYTDESTENLNITRAITIKESVSTHALDDYTNIQGSEEPDGDVVQQYLKEKDYQ